MIMRAKEFSDLKTWRAKVKLPGKSNNPLIDTQVVARNYDLAKRLIRAQYGPDSLIGNVTEVK